MCAAEARKATELWSIERAVRARLGLRRIRGAGGDDDDDDADDADGVPRREAARGGGGAGGARSPAQDQLDAVVAEVGSDDGAFLLERVTQNRFVVRS